MQEKEQPNPSHHFETARFSEKERIFQKIYFDSIHCSQKKRVELAKNNGKRKITQTMTEKETLENHTMVALLLVALACCVSAHDDRETITKTSNVFTPSAHSGWFNRKLFERTDAAEIPKAVGESSVPASSNASSNASSAAPVNATGCDGTTLDEGTGKCGTCTDEFTTQCGAFPVLIAALVAVLALIV